MTTVKASALMAMLSLITACTADVASKQGAAGELCAADTDCRQGLFCEARTCTTATPPDDANNAAPPSDPPPGNSECDTDDDCTPDERCDAGRCLRLDDDNNDAPPDITPPPPSPADCPDLCARIQDCDIANNDLCIGVCESTLLDYPPDVGVIILECLLNIDDCDELGQNIGRCLDDTAERARVCDDVADFAEEICREPDLYEETRGACLDGITRPEESFLDINQCLEVDDCQAHTECVAAWSQR